MVHIEDCSVKGCGNMSIDGLDGRCDYHLTPETKTYKVVGTITVFINTTDEDQACEMFECSYPDIEFDDIDIIEDEYIGL